MSALSALTDAELDTVGELFCDHAEVLAAVEKAAAAEERGDSEAAEAHAARGREVNADLFNGTMSLIRAGLLPCPCCCKEWKAIQHFTAVKLAAALAEEMRRSLARCLS